MLGPLIDHKNIFLNSTDFIGDMDYEDSDKFPTNVRSHIFNMLTLLLSPLKVQTYLNGIFISTVRDVL